MSLQLPAVANYSVLASILSDIGASQFLPSFIEAEHDDSCICFFRVAKSVEKLYGLPLELAANFVEKCRAVAARGAQPAGHPSALIVVTFHAVTSFACSLHRMSLFIGGSLPSAVQLLFRARLPSHRLSTAPALKLSPPY